MPSHPVVADLSFALEREAVLLRITLDAAWPLDLAHDVCRALRPDLEMWAGLEHPAAITLSGNGTAIELRWPPAAAQEAFVESVRHTLDLRSQIDSRLREGWGHGLRRRKVIRELNAAITETAAGPLTVAA